MFATLKTAALAAAIGLGSIASVPMAAQAEGLYLNYRDGNGSFGIGIGDQARYNDHGRYNHWKPQRKFCTPERAANKAERLGLHRVRVVDVTRHTIKVRGRAHGDRVTLVFGKEPHCPIVRW